MIPDDVEIKANMPAIKPSIIEACDVASAEWDRLLAAMPSELYDAADVSLLSEYALAWKMLIESQAEIDSRGALIEENIYNKDGEIAGCRLKKNPAVEVWKVASAMLLKAGDRLGLSPATRTQLQFPSPSEQPQPQRRFQHLIAVP